MSKTNPYRLSGNLFAREEGIVFACQLFFLSCEGAKSEPSYFNNLNRHLRDIRGGGALVHVLKHPNDGLSSVDAVYELLEECRAIREEEKLIPDSVYQEIEKSFSNAEITQIMRGDGFVDEDRKKQFLDALLSLGINLDYRQYLKTLSSESEDRFVVVLDRDADSHTVESLNRICQKCRERNYICCLTNPCFEFWLLLHLVGVQTLSDPEEKVRLLSNKKVSKKHTYVSKRVSDLAGHGKRISERVFDVYYWQERERALRAAETFARQNEDILNQLGTSLPDLMDAISESLRNRHKRGGSTQE